MYKFNGHSRLYQIHHILFIRLDVPRLVTTILSASEQYELKYRSKGIEEGISSLHRL